ncbi:MAG: response regulator transcription factor [Chitinophagales bacterium]
MTAPARPEPLATLSPREYEVFLLVAEGMTNSEIGRRLFISEKTVKNYVTKVRKKLGASNRTQVALYALRRGVVELKDE